MFQIRISNKINNELSSDKLTFEEIEEIISTLENDKEYYI